MSLALAVIAGFVLLPPVLWLFNQYMNWLFDLLDKWR